MNTDFAILGFLSSIGPWELIVIGGLALLLFGGRLPEVGRSLGRGIVEFKKGLKDVEDDVKSLDTTGPDPKPPAKSKEQDSARAAGG